MVLQRTEGLIKVRDKHKKRAGDALFLYELLTSASIGDGIDFWDLDLLQRKLNMTITAVQMGEFRQELDPKGTGYITLPQLLQWMLAKKEGQYFSLFKATSMFVAWCVLNLITSYYYVHAEDKLLTDLRTRSRLELEYQQSSIEALLLAAKIVDDEEAAMKISERRFFREFRPRQPPRGHLVLCRARRDGKELEIERKRRNSARRLQTRRSWTWRRRKRLVVLREKVATTATRSRLSSMLTKGRVAAALSSGYG